MLRFIRLLKVKKDGCPSFFLEIIFIYYFSISLTQSIKLVVLSPVRSALV